MRDLAGAPFIGGKRVSARARVMESDVVHEDAVVARLREPTTRDHGYVASTWARSVMDGPEVFHEPNAWAQINRLIDRLLEDRATRIIVACSPDHNEKLLGFIVYADYRSTRVLLYLSVRSTDRRKGIGSALVRAAGLAEGRISYLFDGPASKWLRAKREDAIKISPEAYLS